MASRMGVMLFDYVTSKCRAVGCFIRRGNGRRGKGPTFQTDFALSVLLWFR